MNILSLFDGMSCLQIALKELEIPVSKYCYSEIDVHAIKQTQLNFPDAIHVGDVTKWREWDIDWSKVDLIGGGSPCQGFSFAGKQLAFDDPRSKLFFVFADILAHCKSLNPDVKFLLENVNMKKSHMKVISDYVGILPVTLTATLFPLKIGIGGTGLILKPKEKACLVICIQAYHNRKTRELF